MSFKKWRSVGEVAPTTFSMLLISNGLTIAKEERIMVMRMAEKNNGLYGLLYDRIRFNKPIFNFLVGVGVADINKK